MFVLRCTITIVGMNFKGIFLIVHLKLAVHHKKIKKIVSLPLHPTTIQAVEYIVESAADFFLTVNIEKVKTTNAHIAMAHL